MWHSDRRSFVNGTGLATYAGMTLPRVRPFAWAATLTPPTDESRRLLNVMIALLALVIVLQFLENLTDRQAADAGRLRLDWKYLLSLERDLPWL